ncbi:MAG: 4-coumarate--CoA ligase, partial [Pseudomonadota bacterium]
MTTGRYTDTSAPLSVDDHQLFRLIASLVAQELSISRRSDPSRLGAYEWTQAVPLFDDGLALDSLERINCSAALNQFFHLHEYGAEDYLLAADNLGDWVKLVRTSITEGSGHLTFTTSGSTGTPK